MLLGLPFGGSSSGTNSVSVFPYLNTIAERDAIPAGNRTAGMVRYVHDATDDDTVDVGWAIYRLGEGLSNADWIKTGEQEGLDLLTGITNSLTNDSETIAASALAAKNLKDSVDSKINSSVLAYTQQDPDAGTVAINFDGLDNRLHHVYSEVSANVTLDLNNMRNGETLIWLVNVAAPGFTLTLANDNSVDSFDGVNSSQLQFLSEFNSTPFEFPEAGYYTITLTNNTKFIEFTITAKID